MDYSKFFVRDPQICGGELTVKGIRGLESPRAISRNRLRITVLGMKMRR